MGGYLPMMTGPYHSGAAPTNINNINVNLSLQNINSAVPAMTVSKNPNLADEVLQPPHHD